MQFEIEHTIAAPRHVVEIGLGDPGFYEVFGGMPDVSAPTLLDRTEKDGVIEVRVRCAFTGELSAAVTAVIDPSKLSWVSTITLRPSNHMAELSLTPDHYGDRVECSAVYLFKEAADASTHEVVDGDLVVHFPLVAGKVERAILGGIKQYVAGEARALGRWATTQT